MFEDDESIMSSCQSFILPMPSTQPLHFKFEKKTRTSSLTFVPAVVDHKPKPIDFF